MWTIRFVLTNVSRNVNHLKKQPKLFNIRYIKNYPPRATLFTVFRREFTKRHLSIAGVTSFTIASSLFLVNSSTNFEEKHLLKAAQFGNVHDIKRICGAKGEKLSPDIRHALGWTPLMVAAANGHVEAVETLLKCGAQIDLQDIYHNPQKTAKKFGLHPLEVLLKREDEFCETLNGRATYSGFTSLHYAALADFSDVTEVLMKAGADPTLRDHAGRRALDYAKDGSETQKLLDQYTKKVEILLEEKQIEERRRFPLEQRLRQFIVGQQGAINTVAAAIRRKENGWADDEHPLVFLFLGSSGIGKTELAKQVANYIHKNNIHGFIRLDMSEYQEKHEVAKLIGAPPGYIGHEDGGQLTKCLAKQKNAVVLFDEVDKAHPDVLTVLLQLFDEGRLTDGKGKLIECKDAIFVMTSNLASDEIAKYGLQLRKEAEIVSKNKIDGKITRDENEDVPEEITVSRNFKDNIVRPILKSHFGRDEFLGRINEIVYFLPFSRQELLTLVTRELNIWAKKAKSRHYVDLIWDNGILGCLADGYDVHYGARSIKYEVERRVVNKIALAAERGLLSKESVVEVTCTDEGAIVIRIKKKGESKFTVI